MNIVIMAGGGGTRLWPLSLKGNPKQFVDLGTGKPLLLHAYERAVKVTAADRVYVATSETYASRIHQILPQVPRNRLFLEPSRRDTTAAFVHVCLQLKSMGQGDEPTTFLWSDHLFANESEFIGDLKRIPDILAKRPNSLVIIGHTPLNPNTALGYFRIGQALAPHMDVFEVAEFTEKPSLAKAEKFVATGNYFWNLGYFSLRPNYLLEEIVRVSPGLAAPIAVLAQAVTAGMPTAIADAFNAFPKQALEFTFVEKTKSILAITGDYGWSDIGNWGTVKDILGVKGDHMPAGHHVHVDSENNYVYNTTNKAVSLIGIQGMIVVVTDKAVLVTDEKHSHKVKQVVEQIEREGKEEYL